MTFINVYYKEISVTLFLILCWVEPTFHVAVAATIRWGYLARKFGALVKAYL